MKNIRRKQFKSLLVVPMILVVAIGLVLTGCVNTSDEHLESSEVKSSANESILIRADRVFDGYTFKGDTSVLIVDGKIVKIDTPAATNINAEKVVDLGDATLFPGFIELHAHSNLQQIPQDILLRHGITTIRDLNGTPHKPYGGDGSIRVLTAGRSLTAPGGYPITTLGVKAPSIAVSTEKEAREAVAKNIKEGAVIIKVALEPGFEPGAPWSGGKSHSPISIERDEHTQFWPMLSEEIVSAIVDEAHKLDRKVIAHVGESKGAEISLNAGVDEWAHMPCEVLPKELLKRAVDQGVKVVTTMDTLSRCSGTFENAKELNALGAEFLYGSEIAHKDIPWGIDAQELIYIMQITGKSMGELLQLPTSKAGENLNIPLLGTLQKGAPADILAIRGSVMGGNIKALEYPDFVMSGGKIVANNFK